MEVLRDLIPRVWFGRLRSSELTDAMITMTNLGDLGVETVYGVIYPPLFGRIVRGHDELGHARDTGLSSENRIDGHELAHVDLAD
jgi:hypothetical protein